jgi:AcrR family transcriptional regulator
MVSTAHDMKADTTVKRTYTMRSRAESVERTRQEIVSAAFALCEERVTFMISLADVAERAGVTMRTILRHFGSRDGLFQAVGDYARGLVAEERVAPVGDIDAAVRSVVDHYEKRGRHALRMIEEEGLDPNIADNVRYGRRFHRDWVRTAFGPQLADAKDPDGLLDLLVVASDLYTWKLLRLDMGLSRRKTEQRITTMIRRLAGEGA